MTGLKSASILTALCGLSMSSAGSASPPLAYQVTEGLNHNSFLQQTQVAAHLVLRSGDSPRVLVAFPAGDSAVAVWFKPVSANARWHQATRMRPVHQSDERGRPLHGVTAEISIDLPELEVQQAVLSSVRVVRDYQSLGTLDDRLRVAARTDASTHTLSWHRERLDGALSYQLSLQVLDGTLDGVRFRAGADGRIGLRITALSGEVPLTPLGGSALLNESAAHDATTRDALGFLSYREKLLAGSWRFDTYFGRDTLMSVRLLMPVLSATAVESGLSSVLSRLSSLGEVAHEEDIGERAVLDHLQKDGTSSAAPVYDYKMIDGDYLLAPVAVAWLLDDARARSRAPAFLRASVQSVGARGGTQGAALLDNLRRVLRTTQAFAHEPIAGHLIGLREGYAVGDWRDSETGLGGGHYPYDVNAALVPAALEAAARLHESKLLEPYENADDRVLLAQARDMARIWRMHAPVLFDVALAHDAAAAAVERYASSQGIPSEPALTALGTQPMKFHALALTAGGEPVAVMNSDLGFELLFGEPDAVELGNDVEALMRPFPAGLMTSVGLLVANPAFAETALQNPFSRNAYHGTVVWSWQQALFAAGLARQLQRRDLPAEVRGQLRAAQAGLWAVIAATSSMSNSELWSWSIADGGYQVAPFGATAADADESDAAQLWSTVYLAVRAPPRPDRR